MFLNPQNPINKDQDSVCGEAETIMEENLAKVTPVYGSSWFVGLTAPQPVRTPYVFPLVPARSSSKIVQQPVD